MKRSGKIICCAAIATVLGIGATIAVAAQSAESVEPPVLDAADEVKSSETADRITSEPAKPVESAPEVSKASDTDISVVGTESTAPAEPEEKPGSEVKEEVKQYLPTANAPEDINYCDPDCFTAGSTPYNGSVIIPAARGSEVFAVSGGEVIFAGMTDASVGNTIVIKHGEDKYAMYCHLEWDTGILVQKGDTVKAGQVIGRVGSSGRIEGTGLGYRCMNTIPKFAVQ